MSTPKFLNFDDTNNSLQETTNFNVFLRALFQDYEVEDGTVSEGVALVWGDRPYGIIKYLYDNEGLLWR